MKVTNQRIRPRTLMGLLFSTLFLCSFNSLAMEENYIQSAAIGEISPQNQYISQKKYIGKIKTKQLTDVSFEYSGKITSVYFDSGDNVKQGDLLAELDTELLHIRMNEISADINKIKAQIALNESNLSRVKSLIDKNYSSQQSLDELYAEKGVLQANIERLHASQALLNYQIKNAKLYAPFNAVISRRLSAQGERINSGAAIFSLIKSDHVEVTIGVPVKVAKTLKVGQSVSAHIGEEQLQLSLIAIGQQVDSLNHTVELRFDLDQTERYFNNQLAIITIDQPINVDGFWVPISALIDGVRGQWNIYLIEPNNDNQAVISAATVSILYTNNDFAYIKGLPRVQQKIITEGVHRYVPGQKVRAVMAKEKVSNH